MATPESVTVNCNATLLTNLLSTPSLFYKDVTLPFTQSNSSRVLILKEASEYPGPSIFAVRPTIGDYILRSTMIYLNSNESITLQANTGPLSNYWGILGGYSGVSTFSTQVIPVASQIVNPSMKVSNIFVDLRTQSKTIVLPPTATLTPSIGKVPIYTIKDIYGMANTNTLYISSSYNDTLERSSINNSIGITQAYASIDLAANLSQHKWHILNYYNGSLVANP